MKLSEMEEECLRVVERWENPGLPKLPGNPVASFAVPNGVTPPTEILGVPTEIRRNARGSIVWIDARQLLKAIAYAREELLVPSETP